MPLITEIEQETNMTHSDESATEFQPVMSKSPSNNDQSVSNSINSNSVEPVDTISLAQNDLLSLPIAVINRLLSLLPSVAVAVIATLLTLHIIGPLKSHPTIPRTVPCPSEPSLYPYFGGSDMDVKRTEAWSILTEKPSGCLGEDLYSSKPAATVIVYDDFVVPQSTGGDVVSHPKLLIRAGGQMRSHIRIITQSVNTTNTTSHSNDPRAITVEYSVMYDGVEVTNYIEHHTVNDYDTKMIWLNSGSTGKERYNFQHHGDAYSKGVPSCAYANIAVIIPEYDLNDGKAHFRMFIAATRPNIVVDESARPYIESLNVVEPLQRLRLINNNNH
ncbi:hypothetical protein GQ42DRAFT_17183 [Ramicandelaber brevisporus]|nr:hypothetical protein GQ42DRAFT_17183 [Ramicandelaber brevisporus]